MEMNCLLYLTLILAVGNASSKCDSGWLGFGQSCYMFYTTTMDWLTAGSYCQDHLSELASIESAEENAFIAAEMIKIGGRGVYWLGGSDNDTEGIWEWVALEQEFEYLNWHSRQPDDKSNEDCLEIRTDYHGQWNDHPCNVKNKFICERRYIKSYENCK